MKQQKYYRLAAIALVGLALHGCASGGMNLFPAGRDIAAGAGIDHTPSGVAYKTFAASAGDLRLATLDALRRMDLAVLKDSPETNAHAIIATTSKRRVEIRLEPLSGRSSRMRVAANGGKIFFKGAAAAAEIIVQTAATLDDLAQRRQVARRPDQPTG